VKIRGARGKPRGWRAIVSASGLPPNTDGARRRSSEFGKIARGCYSARHAMDHHGLVPKFPAPLARHLKSEAAYAARGPTDRPPRSWRATHFNQFPWRTAVTTTWPHLASAAIAQFPLRRGRSNQVKLTVQAPFHGYPRARRRRRVWRRWHPAWCLAVHTPPSPKGAADLCQSSPPRLAHLQPRCSKGAAAAILVMDALRMCG
jgi:hypothetical protein